MALSGKGEQLRRCQAYTLDGLGPPCKNWAKIFSNYCNLHNGKIRYYPDEDDRDFRRLFPKKYKSRRVCSCSAYPFKHGFGAGLCLFPDPPEEQLVIDINPLRTKTNNVETIVKKKLRRMGVHNKNTNCIKKRTSDVRRIINHDLEKDFFLEQDYLSKMIYLEDFSSLPIEQKRRIWKKQILEELYTRHPELRLKQYLKKEPDEQSSSDPLHYKVVKEKVRQRNEEIIEKAYMILETGERIPLE